MFSRLLASLILVLCVAPLSAAPPTVDSLRSEIDKKLAAVENEVQRLRKLGATEDAQSLAARLEALRDQAAGKDVPQQNAAPEVHVVGLYEGSFPDGPRKFGRSRYRLWLGLIAANLAQPPSPRNPIKLRFAHAG